MLLSILGFVYFIKNKSKSLLLVLCWIFVYFIFVSIMGWKEGRFLMYILPGFAVLAALGLNWILPKIKLAKSSIFWIFVISVIFLTVTPITFLGISNDVFSQLWPYAKSPADWELWDYVDQLVDKNDYLLTNNYGMVEIYSRPSDALFKNWQTDSMRFLMFDSQYALIETNVDYPRNSPEIFTPIKSFNFVTYENNISLILYKVDLEKLSQLIYGNNTIKVTGKIYDVNTGQSIHRAKLLAADPSSGQLIGIFYSKMDGTVTAYLPAHATYLMQTSAFGYELKNLLVDLKPDAITICETQNQCFQKPSLEIGLAFKSFLVHEYPNVRF